jgi:hypothetical protein
MNNTVHRINFSPKKRKTPKRLKFLTTESNQFIMTESGQKIKLS